MNTDAKRNLIKRLIDERPAFHNWPDGSAANWATSDDVLAYIVETVRPGMVTLETGVGYSTLAFAIAGSSHTCVTSQREQASRVELYCRRIAVERANLRFICESSDFALARKGVVPPSLDFVFIDGAHRFPFPCLDWHYTERSLRLGGIVGIDDCDIPSVRVLHDFLAGEPEWEMVQRFVRSTFFRRVSYADVALDFQAQVLNRCYVEQCYA